jgi:hypothetical protein
MEEQSEALNIKDLLAVMMAIVVGVNLLSSLIKPDRLDVLVGLGISESRDRWN